MNKKEFTKLMEEFISLRKAETKLNDALKEFNSDFNYFSFGRWETMFIRTLEFAMNDKDEWISYFIYDLELGESDLTVKDPVKIGGEPVSIKTISDLYNLLTKK